MPYVPHSFLSVRVGFFLLGLLLLLTPPPFGSLAACPPLKSRPLGFAPLPHGRFAFISGGAEAPAHVNNNTNLEGGSPYATWLFIFGLEENEETLPERLF